MSLSTDFLKGLNKPLIKEEAPKTERAAVSAAANTEAGGSVGAPVADVTPQTSREKANAAAKELEVYRASEEYRANQQARNRQHNLDLIAHRMLTGTADTFGPALKADEKEERLKAEAEKWKQTADREELAAKGDSAALDSYILERDQHFYQQLNPMTDPGFGVQHSQGVQDLIAREGAGKVNTMAAEREAERNAETAAAVERRAREQVNKGGWSAVGANLASVGANLVSGYTGTIEAAKDLAHYRRIDPNNMGQMPGVYAGAVRGQSAQNIAGDRYDEAGNQIQEGGTGRQLVSYGYQGLMSAADSAARLLSAGGSADVGKVIAGLQGFSGALREATQKGATPAQAVAMGVATAGFEALTEGMGLDNLADIITKGGKGLLRNLLKQAGTEIAEEEISFALDLLAEAVILREKSGFNQNVQALMAQGMSEQEARAQVTRELWKEAGETAIISGISGGISAAGGQLANASAGGLQKVQGQENRTEEAAAKERVERYKAATVNDTLLKMIDRVKTGIFTGKEKIQMGDVPAAAVPRIKELTGVDTTGFKVAIETRQIAHILKDHGENGTTDHSMADPADIARMEYVLHNPDEIRYGGKTDAYTAMRNGRNRTVDTVLYETRLADNSYYVVQAVPDTKKKTLYIVTAFMGEPGYKKNGSETAPKTGAPQSSNTTNPNATPGAESVVTQSAPQSIDTGSPAATPEIAAAVTPDSTIAGSRTKVNENLVKGGSDSGVSAVEGQSPEGGQNAKGMRGTGAAARGFTPKQALINQYGNIPEGENPVRSDQLPQSTDGTDRVSATARTAVEARVTPDEFVPLIENATVNGRFSYIPITNNETVQRATQTIAYEGWQTARANWQEQVHNGVTSPEITAIGALLYNHAVNAGDHEEAMEILADYQMAVRNSAQALQAARILKTLTPTDRLWMIRKSVEAMVKDLKLKKTVEINKQLADAYVNAGTQEEADEILDEIARDIARQIPTTGMEAFTALRYVNMLGNFRTQVRNIAGNMGSKIVYGIKDKIGAGVEAIASTLTGGRIERTKSFTTDRATREAAAADFEQVQQWVQNGGRYNDRGTESDDFRQRVQESRRLLPPVLEQYRRLTNWAMEAGDTIFSRSAYARALAGYLNARGIRTGDLSTVDPETLDRARAYAVRQAQEQTFRDNNQISDFVGGILRGRNTPVWARVLGEGIMPFRKTPANVLVRAEEFSPLGLINSTVNTIRAARGEITGAELVESWSKTLTGTALFAMGAFLADMGWLNGGPDEDEDKAAFDQLNGQQNYSLEFNWNGETYTYTIDWLTPAAMPMFLGAQLQKVFREKGEDISWADWEKVLTAVGDPLISMSMLQGLSDTLGDLRYAENNLGQFLINAATSYLTQGLTNTLLGQMERSTEESRMTTYIDKDSAMPQWLQRQMGKASAKTPGWDFQQTEYINARGETEAQDTGPLGWLYNLASPGYIDRKQVDSISEELYRLSDAGVEGNVFPRSPETKFSYTDASGTVHRDYNLTMEQADTLKRVAGQTATETLESLFASDAYKAMTDSQKAKAVQAVYDYAREMGRKEAVDGYQTGEKWMEGIEGNPTEVIINRNLNAAISDSVKVYDPEGLESAWKVYGKMDSRQKKAFYEAAGTEARNYIDARERKISSTSYLAIAKTIDQLKPENGRSGVRSVQKAEAITRSRLPERQMVEMLKLELSDAQAENVEEAQELGFTAREYAIAYRLYEDYAKGKGKKKATVAELMEQLGIDRRTAEALYEVFS